uniref:Uncharacterized protein n=1 Tax=Ananas comosus var. bracteatus TaxID=296719 RepID=A0A6V7NQV5_ANACO|nr:unnamed protein product [Ananas comosus var. bracteatus]
MEEAVLGVAMATHAILAAATISFSSPAPLPPHSSARPFHPAIIAQPLKLLFPSPSAAAAPKPLAVVAATKKAVSVLKGSSMSRASSPSSSKTMVLQQCQCALLD